jgi:hypothetical protein
VRENERNIIHYNIHPYHLRGKKTISDINTSYGDDNLNKIEESVILKRWKSPSIIEALKYKNALRMIIFCTAIFFKYRFVNKKMQLYGNQIDKDNNGEIGKFKVEDILCVRS